MLSSDRAGASKAAPLLLSGSHRSGTSWAGRMLAASGRLGYIHEPFNPHHRPGICSARFPYWFFYVCAENESAFVEPMRRTIALRYDVRAELAATRSPRDFIRASRDWSRFTHLRHSGQSALLKDPIAFFSAEWLADRLGLGVIMMIRHPAAFSASLLRLGWTHPFDHFLRQPLLMRDHLSPFADQLEEFAAREHDIVDQSVLLWRMIHHVMLTFRARRPAWRYIRYEDLALHPLDGFETLYGELGLPFHQQARTTVDRFTSPSEGSEVVGPRARPRDSRQAAQGWKRQLDKALVRRIHSSVEDVSAAFYSDAEW